MHIYIYILYLYTKFIFFWSQESYHSSAQKLIETDWFSFSPSRFGAFTCLTISGDVAKAGFGLGVWGRPGGPRKAISKGFPLKVYNKTWKLVSGLERFWSPERFIWKPSKIDWFWGNIVPFSRGHVRGFILVFEGFFSFKVGFWLVSGSFRFTLWGGYRSDRWASIPSEMYMVFTVSSYPLWSFGATLLTPIYPSC